VCKLDPRLHAFRHDLADERLKGRVKADRFVAGEARRIIVPVADIKSAPNMQAGVMSQLVLGDDVLVFEGGEDFCFIQSSKDNYVGYVRTAALGGIAAKSTHYICVPRTFLYPNPDIKLPILKTLSLGSRVTIHDFVERHGTSYGQLDDGTALFANHLMPIDKPASDYVTVAQSLIFTPYLWGGTCAFGIDCSGLVQLSLAVAGEMVLRDSDMQCETIGEILPQNTPLQRGDLVFWRGHVAIVCDGKRIIHANGASMDVRIEPYTQAVKRIANHYGMPIAHRRPLQQGGETLPSTPVTIL